MYLCICTYAHAGKRVVPSDSKAMRDEIVEKLTLLRINKHFMRFMRKHHPEVVQEQRAGGFIRLPKQRSRQVGKKTKQRDAE